MAFIALTDDELSEARFLMGQGVKENVVTNEILRRKTIHDAASDYVLENLLKDIDVSRLGVAEDEYRNIRDGSATEADVTSFLNAALKVPQLEQFRRAVIYRVAGLGVPSIDRLLSEDAIGINQRLSDRKWNQIQASLFQRSDEEIDRLRRAFPDDAFPDAEERVKSGRGRIRLMSVLRSS